MVAEETGLSQRRRERRFECRVPVLCTVGGRTCTATVVNFAHHGLGLVLPQKVKTGATLTLHYNTAAVVKARVQWTHRSGDGYEIGVACPTGTLFWVPGLLRALPQPPSRAEERQTLARPRT
ncbi:MAG TPA: PilZ domain-containing protein [Candidatus Xenobia bacterium]